MEMSERLPKTVVAGEVQSPKPKVQSPKCEKERDA